MKRILSIIILVSLTTFLITGCSNDSSTVSLENYNISEAGTWKDGIYTETAKGKKGNFDVTVTIENRQIADIVIGDNSETPEKGGVAIETIPQEIIDAQSIDVDSVSGASITSNGIKDAVAKCLEKASI
jgi:uncharacterized protein with FMN-binding domain